MTKRNFDFLELPSFVREVVGSSETFVFSVFDNTINSLIVRKAVGARETKELEFSLGERRELSLAERKKSVPLDSSWAVDGKYFVFVEY